MKSIRIGKVAPWFSIFVFAILLFSISLRAAEDRNAKILNDRSSVQKEGLWIYNDLPKALAQGRLSGKPILVALRCVP